MFLRFGLRFRFEKKAMPLPIPPQPTEGAPPFEGPPEEEGPTAAEPGKAWPERHRGRDVHLHVDLLTLLQTITQALSHFAKFAGPLESDTRILM